MSETACATTKSLKHTTVSIPREGLVLEKKNVCKLNRVTCDMDTCGLSPMFLLRFSQQRFSANASKLARRLQKQACQQRKQQQTQTNDKESDDDRARWAATTALSMTIVAYPCAAGVAIATLSMPPRVSRR
jgi:hypothetical protein